MTDTPIIRIEAVSKIYGGIAAVENVNFDLHAGEIHALAGENGAGKSTLCKLIAGVTTPTTGRIFVDGEEVNFANPKDATERGIAMVFQETSLVPQLTVAQNMVLGREKPLNSVRRVLTPEETEHLFDLVKRLQKRGVALIFISHALEEALTHADRITVLRNGHLVTTGPAAEFDRAVLIRHMIGEELVETAVDRVPARARAAAPVLQVEDLRMGSMVNNMSFSVFPGEVTGIAGLIGSGRSEAAKVIVGHTKRNLDGGRIWLDGKEIRYSAPSQAIADGIAYVSEDRKYDGFFDTMSVTRNIGLGWLAKFRGRRVLTPRKALNAVAHDWRSRLAIHGAQGDKSVVYLSGGNQQKVVIAKSLAQEPRLVIFDEPTRGVDVGAITEIRKIIRGIADSGAGVILISSYLPEILDLSDRILVAKSGTIVAEFARAEASAQRILHAAIH